jgi:hypothetical protein
MNSRQIHNELELRETRFRLQKEDLDYIQKLKKDLEEFEKKEWIEK